jgi:hypothetical protein
MAVLYQAVEILLMRRDTALKTGSKCSFIPYKLRFFTAFRLVSHSPERISTACCYLNT